ncbi:ras-associated and pleckstrin homology domains-containing protein pico isoform X2 [Oratosquilla oratoria]|uniref:ras-associated and pleckstrin homology domains-containing protein pico isoform X2 n=1 Tax=Oratosquilla oratoria TaxID=337810 RepID=UPI003F77533B
MAIMSDGDDSHCAVEVSEDSRCNNQDSEMISDLGNTPHNFKVKAESPYLVHSSEQGNGESAMNTNTQEQRRDHPHTDVNPVEVCAHGSNMLMQSDWSTGSSKNYDYAMGDSDEETPRRDSADDALARADEDVEAILRHVQEFLAEETGVDNVDSGEASTGGGGPLGARQHTKLPAHPPRIDAHRFSRANLEDSGDVELDAILGELCALESQFELEIVNKIGSSLSSASASAVPITTANTISAVAASVASPANTTTMQSAVGRTDSPDNDSAFSDNVSMLSSESSASSGASGSAGSRQDASKAQLTQAEQAARVKAEKIKMALEKIKEANVKKLFIKAFTVDDSTKSLLVDEKMTVGHVSRLLADKNHVRMDPKWAVVEHIPDLYMERIYEDDEMIVDNLLLWTRDSKNKLLFLERPEKYDLFLRPELYLLIGSSSQKDLDLDDEGRSTLLEEFFSSSGVGVPEVEGPLFLKSEGKKVWKKFYFVLRASGLYYCPKGKSSRSSKDLLCLATLEINQVYYGVGWKKKYKAPTDWCFAIKPPHLQTKSSKYIKYLCAEDSQTLARWVMGMRIAKSGKQLIDNYKSLVEDLAQEDIDMLASSRSFSVASMTGVSTSSRGASQATTPSSESRSVDSCLAPSIGTSIADGDDGDDAHSSTGSSSQDTPVNTLCRPSMWRQDSLKSGSSSSSSGCLSERSSASTPTCEHGFEADFPQGTIKRKPSSNPKLPLTTTTRLLVKEVEGEEITDAGVMRGTLRQSVRRSLTEEVNTLRRRNSVTQSRSSMASSSSQPPQEEEMDSLPLPPPPPELMGDSDTESLPPPPPELLASTLSLNSLPPPPDEASLPPTAPEDLMTASITSLPPPPPPLNIPTHPASPTQKLPPPPPTTPKPSNYKAAVAASRGSTSPVYQSVVPPAVAPKPSREAIETAIYSAPPYLAELRAQTAAATQVGAGSQWRGEGQYPSPPPPPPPPPASASPPVSADPTYARPQKSPQKKVKRITFVDDVQEITTPPLSPSAPKPLPPRRSDSTKLSIPKRLDTPGSKVTPPRSFLTNLQRVMQKKWQVAQKCKDFDKMPHEVLGFRDPLPPTEAERNVGAWIQEHYGSLYENLSPHGSPPYSGGDVGGMEEGGAVAPPPRPAHHTIAVIRPPIAQEEHRVSQTLPGKKKPPPPPPKRADSTQLSTRQ